MTIRELARAMDVAERTVSRWRKPTARGPSIADCAEIARVLGVPITDLVPDATSRKIG